ncbi:hypothetical protein [Holophaga foetida]|uniref:hypothetical protein n=1 Tax=Holophaga foetida TaxID=35839 RepID=UPI0002474CD2|nr:hypothetical protein [Holophaga foetida]
MSRIQLPLFLLLGASLAAQTQEPRIGLGLNLSFPTGAFSQSTYVGQTYTERETYDMGIGGQISASFPLDQHVAFRAVLAGQYHSGENRAVGYDDINLEHSIVSLGGEIHIPIIHVSPKPLGEAGFGQDLSRHGTEPSSHGGVPWRSIGSSSRRVCPFGISKPGMAQKCSAGTQW